MWCEAQGVQDLAFKSSEMMLRVRSRYPESGGKLDSTSPENEEKMKEKRHSVSCEASSRESGFVETGNGIWKNHMCFFFKLNIYSNTLELNCVQSYAPSHHIQLNTCHVIIWPTPFSLLTKQLDPNWTLAASASDVGSQISNRSCHLRLCSWTRRSFSIRSNIWVMCSSNSSDLAGRWWTLQVGFYLRTWKSDNPSWLIMTVPNIPIKPCNLVQ